MSSYKKRYAVLQDEKFKKAQVIDAKSITKATNAATGTTGLGQDVLEGIYAEDSKKPFAEKASSGPGGDVSVSASGVLYDTREAVPVSPYLTSDNILSRVKNRKTYGDGLVINDGSGDDARYSFAKGDSNSYQLRTTPNYFDRSPHTLAYEFATNLDTPSSYTRPTVLSLKNGNLLCAYVASLTFFCLTRYQKETRRFQDYKSTQAQCLGLKDLSAFRK
jgi:hypothetical protein